MEERLQKILGWVNEWLRFAEAKNALLLAANSGMVFGLLKIISEDAGGPGSLARYCLYFGVAFLALSGGAALLSFVPSLRLDWLGTGKTSRRYENLLYFGEIAHFEPAAYLGALRSKCPEEAGCDLEEHYAQQIVMNSKIALNKFVLFGLAVKLTLLSLATVLLGGLLRVISVRSV